MCSMTPDLDPYPKMQFILQNLGRPKLRFTLRFNGSGLRGLPGTASKALQLKQINEAMSSNAAI